MEHKPIYLDGVDVSGCSVYKDGICILARTKCNAVCDYASYYLREQLARKTQECKELEEQDYKNLKIIHSDFNQIKSLRAENTRYRKALEEIEEIAKINCEEICGRKFEDCNDFLCPSKNIIDIINKAKGR